MAEPLTELILRTFGDASFRTVALGCALLGITCGALGCFTILRKRALVSDAVSHASLPGVCLAFMIVGERNFGALLLGAFVLGLVAAGTITLMRTYTRIKEDAATALVIGGFFGFGIVLSRIIQNNPAGNRAGLDSFIFGKAASLVGSDLTWILVTSTLILILLVLFFKELTLLCFDRNFAAGIGWPVFGLDLFLMALVTLSSVVGLPAVGAVLIVSLLIIPGLTARLWTDSVTVMVQLAGALGGISAFVGTLLSTVLPTPEGSLSRGWPTGPLITLVASALFFLSLFISPRRGILSDWWKQRAFRASLRKKELPA
jgi:manganese/zinc/iron transport system permease protein